MKTQSVFSGGNGPKNYEDFFCSQLIAAAYKTVGLLPNQRSTTQYWPGNFTQEGNLKLRQGAELGPEMLINFNL